MENLLESIQLLTVKDLNLVVPESKAPDMERLADWLTAEITKLIDTDFNAFLNMLYRIDVNERKVKEAFAGTDPARHVALLIIAREKQKVETRAKYKD